MVIFALKKNPSRFLFISFSCIIICGFVRFVSLWYSLKTTTGPSYLFSKTTDKKFVEKLKTDTLPNSTYSKISFIDRKHAFTVGEVLTVKITLFNSMGIRIRRGGDMLRIILKETKLAANVNGNITDNGDGTYIGTVLLPWRGEPQLVVYLSLPRQVHEIVVNAANRYGIMRHIMGIFKKYKNISETTPCGPLPVIQGFKNLYNLTEMAYNMPWYCVKPKSDELTDKHWKYSVTAANFTLPLNVTRVLLAHQHKPLLKRIVLKVDGEKTMETSRSPCHKLAPEKTWEVGTSGFYYNNTWVNINCRHQYKQTPNQYAECLQGRHLLLIGDSNIRSYIEFFTKFLRLKVTIGNPMENAPGVVLGHNRARSISVTWRSHGVPYFAAFPYSNRLLIPTSLILDRLNVRSDSRTIVVIHLWTHFLTIPIHVVEERIRDVRKAIERLLARAPYVTVVIKGPQSHLENQIFLQVDFKRVSFERIWRNEFQYLKNRVIYLNYWDITTGSESKQLHPGPKILDDMVSIFINHVCNV
ncbi:NXPE family member 4-like [Ylistrum balloti]|uniref:NXPE family member 4-like n=1 Tax=Ylistrum balloti TaxID=509963 RepID=UPI0029059197|nr:NXPE family member 4-like [Ylistrum balloti]